MISAVIYVGAAGSTVQAQFLTDKPLVPTSESRLWIRGATSVSTYKCQARTIRGFGFLADTTLEAKTKNDVAVVKVEVPVRELDCGKKGINRDMYAALKSETHPHIHYELKKIDASLNTSADLSDVNQWLSIHARGKLAIAGSTRTVTMKVQGKQLDDQRVRVKGKKRLNMKNFGVNPPTALFGLVKVDDSLTVHYDLITAPVDTLPRHKLQQMLGR